jgi:hypothetical protein
MSFKSLQESVGTSPAAKLHAQYVKVAPQNSGTGYWKTVLAAGVSFEQAEAIIRWLANGGLPDLPHAKTIAKNAVWYAELASRDPMATYTNVSVEAFEMAVKIADAGFEIEAEYVQDALTKYRDYLKKAPVDDILYNHLPPGRLFILQWFTEIMPNGTPRMRRFHLEHSRFKEFIRLTARAARRG